jgi:SAM-dependent methyltransferase
MLDRLFAPFVSVILNAAPATAHSILDIGCGAGAVSLALAARNPDAQITGVDISEPLVSAAGHRAAAIPNVTFELGDAQRHPFRPTTFDATVSRFGVMFFDDPIEAFANLHRAARPDATLTAIAWRDPAENPFMTTAERAAGPLVPELPQRRPSGPGQFGFADAAYVREILEQSHWSDISIAPIDVPCQMPAQDLENYYTRLGALAQVLPTLETERRAEVQDALREAFQAFVREDGDAHFTAACWMIQATA